MLSPYSPTVPPLRPDEEAAVSELLASLERPVELVLVLGPEETPVPAPQEIDYGAETRKLLEALVALGRGMLTLRVLDGPALGVERYPATCVLPGGEDAGVRFYGLPWGYELTSIVGACVDAGRLEPRLSEESRARLATLPHDVSVEVFVTPTCPHCPAAALMAFRFALASPRVRAAAIEAAEFPAYAEANAVLAVPKTVAGSIAWEGAVPERVFVERLIAAASAERGEAAPALSIPSPHPPTG
jgi:glutaredoxin-like protein